MKILLLIPLAAAVLFSSSCRTACPLDPMTFRPDCSRCKMLVDRSGCSSCGTDEVRVYSSK